MSAAAAPPSAPPGASPVEVAEEGLAGLARVAARALERGLFAPAPAAGLGLARIVLLGGILLFYAGKDLAVFGGLPGALFFPTTPFAWLHLEPSARGPLEAAAIAWKACLALAAIGLFTRASAALAAGIGFYLLGLAHGYGAVKHQDGAVVLTLAVFALSRAGDALSVDALLRARRGAAPPAPSGEYRWPLVAVRALFALVFFGAGVSKLRLGGLAWLGPESFRNILLDARSLNGPGAAPWLADAIVARPLLCRALAAGTVLVETGLPLALVSRRARLVLVPAVASMLVLIEPLVGPSFPQLLILALAWWPWEGRGAAAPAAASAPAASVEPAAPPEKRARWIPAAAAAVALASVVLGFALGFSRLDVAPLGHDEAYTVFHAAGRSPVETSWAEFKGEVSTAGREQALLRPGPGSGGPGEVVRSLANEDPEHAPLYFLAMWAEAHLGLASVADLRAATVLAAVLLVLASAGLGRALGGDATAAAVAAAVVALEPQLFALARVARPSAPAAAVLAASSWLLVRAVRRDVAGGGAGARGAWIAYAVSVALVPYTYPAAAAGLLAHAAFALLDPPPDARRRVVVRFVVAAGAGSLAFAPWALNALVRRRLVHAVLAWTAASDRPSWLAGTWTLLKDARCSRLDGLPSLARPALALAPLLVPPLARGLLPRRALALPAALAASSIAVVGAIDLATGAHASSIGRYLLPSVLGLDLLLALGIAALLRAPGARRPALGAVVLGATLVAGAISCRAAALDPAPGTHWPAGDSLAAARAAAERPDALLVFMNPDGTGLGRTFSLLGELPAERPILLLGPGVPLRVPDEARRLLVFEDATSRLDEIERAGFVEGPAPRGAEGLLRAFERREAR